MAISMTLLGSVYEDTNPGVTIPYGSVTPDGDEAVVAAFCASGVAGATDPALDSPTWLSGAWEEFEVPDPALELNLNIGATVSSPSADTLTLDFGADTLTGGIGIVAKILGADTADLVVDGTAIASGGVGVTSLSEALAAPLSDPSNAVLAIVGMLIQESFAAVDGETIVAQGTHASPTRQAALVYKVGANDIQLSWTTSTTYLIALCEIKAATGAPPSTDVMLPAAWRTRYS